MYLQGKNHQGKFKHIVDNRYRFEMKTNREQERRQIRLKKTYFVEKKYFYSFYLITITHSSRYNNNKKKIYND